MNVTSDASRGLPGSRFLAPALIAPLFSLLVAACGGGGGGSPAPNNATATVVTGRFLDGPVAGITYTTETQSGLTNANGEFKYVAGETVRFSIGAVTLPSALASEVVTPLDLAGTRDVQDPTVTNILVLLQSIDEDRNPANGISITAASRSAATTAISFNQDPARFSSDAGLRSLVNAAAPANAAIVSADQARTHFLQTLKSAQPQLNIAPIANPGANRVVATGLSLSLDGSASTDPNGDSLTYAWAFRSKPQGSKSVLQNSNTPTPSFTPDVAGPYVVGLSVSDASLTSSSTAVTVTAEASTFVTAIEAVGSQGYKVPSTFKVSGGYLGLGIRASATGCSDMSVLPGGSDGEQQIRCTPTTVGNIDLEVRSTAGTLLKTQSVNIPKPLIRMATNKGDMLIELEAAKAPITVDNFLAYAATGFYAGTTFHRVIRTFMVQGGGFAISNGNFAYKSQGLLSPITLEKTSSTGLSNTAGTIAMARTSDPNSATSQFFINVVDNTFLDSVQSADGNGYAVFGKVDLTDAQSVSTLIAIRDVPVEFNSAVGNTNTAPNSSPSTPVRTGSNVPVINAVTRLR